MRNIRFSCFRCGQHLVAEGEWSGLDIHCPGCGDSLAIPAESAVAGQDAERAYLAVPGKVSPDARNREGAVAAGVEHLKSMLEMAELAREALQTSLREATASLSEKEENIRHIQATHESQLQTSRAEFQALKDELSRALATCSGLEAELDKLRADLAVQFDLAELIALKDKAGALEKSFAEERASHLHAVAELELAKAEIHRSREDRLRTELELAASRDALSESKLEQDNAVLRGLIARLDEELEQYRPLSKRAPKRPAPKTRASRRDASSFRWPWSRRLVLQEPRQNSSL